MIKKICSVSKVLLVSAVIFGGAFLHSLPVLAATNLINNPSLETSAVNGTPDFWSHARSGSNMALFSYPVAGVNGGKAANITMSWYLTGEAEWYFQDVAIKPGVKYTFSEQYKSTVPTSVRVRFTNVTGSYSYLTLSSLPAAANWQTKQYTFIAPANAAKLTIFHAITRKGSLTIDDYSLYEVDTQKPTVMIASPLANAQISVPTSIVAQAADNVGVAGVQFYVDGQKFGNEVLASPYSVAFDPAAVSAGTHFLSAVARDSYGNTATSTAIGVTVVYSAPSPDTTAPTASITDPLAGQTLSYSVAIDAQAIDPLVSGQVQSGIDHVQFFVDGTPFGNPDSQAPYEAVLDTKLFADGAHQLGVQATDKAGNVGTMSQISVSFSNASNSALGPNLILNPGFEDTNGTSPAHWNQGNWGTNTAVFSLAAGEQGKGASISMTSYTDGDAKWFFDDVSVTPGIEYTYSDSYISSTSTEVVVRFTRSDGTIITPYGDLGPVPAASSWQNYSHSFTAPDNAVSVTVFHLIAGVGSLTIDNASLNAWPAPQSFSQGMVSLDFDDGWAVTYQNALPILNAAGYKSTQYIISGSLTDPEYVNAKQVLDMQSQGEEIGSHTKTHTSLVTLPQAQMQDEIAGSKSDLEAIGVNTIRSFDYPYGDWNNEVVQTVENSSYLGARTASPQDFGFNFQNGNTFLLRTQAVDASTTLDTVKQWINEAIANKTWVILVFHQIDNSGTQYSTTPANLQAIVDYLKSESAKVITASQGIYQMTHK